MSLCHGSVPTRTCRKSAHPVYGSVSLLPDLAAGSRSRPLPWLVLRPDVLVTFPDVLVTSPDVLVTSLDVLVTSPDVLVTSPDVLVTSTDVLVTSTDVLVTSPDVLVTSTDVLVTSSPQSRRKGLGWSEFGIVYTLVTRITEPAVSAGGAGGPKTAGSEGGPASIGTRMSDEVT